MHSSTPYFVLRGPPHSGSNPLGDALESPLRLEWAFSLDGGALFRIDGLRAVLPDSWVAPCVKDSEHHDALGFHNVEHPVRETSGEEPSDVRVDDCLSQRLASDLLDGCLNASSELLAEATSLVFIPSVGLQQLVLRSPTENDGERAQCRVRSPRFTSSHATTSSGDAACALRRRSSSDRWASLTSTWSGAAAISSHSSCRRRIRSATLSLVELGSGILLTISPP